MFGIKQIPSLLRAAAIADGSIGFSLWNHGERVPLGTSIQAATDAGPCACGLALAGHGDAYNEEAFTYLLMVERKRFERTNRPFLVALVSEAGSRPAEEMDPASASKVFAAVGASLRETDVLGWYRDRAVVGAILTQLGDASLADLSRLMSSRLTATLRTALPEHVARRLDVRLYEPQERLDA